MKRLIILALATLLAGPAMGQVRKPDLLGVPGGIVHAPGTTATTAAGSGDILSQLRAKFTADLNADLTSALALAQAMPPACIATPGNVTAANNCVAADTTAVPCYQALLSLNGVINSYVPPTDKPHVISDLEQLRIINRTVQSSNFRDACAPLIQDINTQVTQLVGQVLAVVGGAAKIGIALP